MARIWYDDLVFYGSVIASSGSYPGTFIELGQAALQMEAAPSAYHMVAEQMGVPVSACCMITAHHWDALGAQFVGYSSALMHRPGQASLPMRGLPQPLAVAADLPGVAAQLVKLRRQR